MPRNKSERVPWFCRDVPVRQTGQTAKLWRVGPIYVITSRLVDSAGHTIETYAFLSDAEGNVLDWEELPGSTLGASNHWGVISEYYRRTQGTS